MSTHDRSGGVGQGVGVWEHIVKWGTHMFTIFTPLFTLCPVSTTLYSGHTLSHGPISSTQHSTTLFYSLQLYSSSTVEYNTPLIPAEAYGSGTDLLQAP